MQPHLRLLRQALCTLGALMLAAASPAFAQGAPTVIRFGSPELGTGAKPFPGANPLAVVKAKGWLEEEFAKDNIKVEWTFFRGAGPAVNEALAAKQLDVVFLGDLASVIGRARGLPTRLIAVTGRGSNSYLAVPPGSTIKTIADLKGRKVSVLKGTAYQRPFDALLADVGLTEKDLRLVNMDWPTSKTALVTQDIDATFGGADLHLLKNKGVTLPVSTKGRGPAYAIYASVLATDDFVTRYPAVTARIVRQLVRASQWASDEANRTALIELWDQNSGQGQAVFKAEFDGESLKARHSPRVDDDAVAVYKSVASDAVKLGLIKQPFDVDAWIAPQFVDMAIKELDLDKLWPRLDRQGKPQ